MAFDVTVGEAVSAIIFFVAAKSSMTEAEVDLTGIGFSEAELAVLLADAEVPLAPEDFCERFQQ